MLSAVHSHLYVTELLKERNAVNMSSSYSCRPAAEAHFVVWQDGVEDVYSALAFFRGIFDQPSCGWIQCAALADLKGTNPRAVARQVTPLFVLEDGPREQRSKTHNEASVATK